MQLSVEQLRVLGSLIEKEITTPENYPLSLNSLINACNQRSSRDPVLDLDEETVRQALSVLENLELVNSSRDSRVTKYEHRARTVLNLRRDETAILCLLLLRGPQTPGELRSRSERMYAFDELAAVVTTLERLASRPAPEAAEPGQPATGPLTLLLPRQPGSREARYMHLLGEPAALEATSATERSTAWSAGSTTAPAAAQESALGQQLQGLEIEIAALRGWIQTLEARIVALEADSQSPSAASSL